MTIKLISTDQIRCTLSNLDLGLRNIKLSELTYGSFQANRLIDEMLKKAAAEYNFDAGDGPLMIEAIPEPDGGISVLITKVEEPEELDIRFSKFHTPSEREALSVPSGNILEGAFPINPPTEESAPAPMPFGIEISEAPLSPSVIVFSFRDMDAVILASKAVNPDSSLHNALYKDEVENRYYLFMEANTADDQALISTGNILAEYGKRENAQYATKAFFHEHYTAIIEKNALQALHRI